MSIQSEAAKSHIEKLLDADYDRDNGLDNFIINYHLPFWYQEYLFAEPRKWRFDYAVPSILCATEKKGTFTGCPEMVMRMRHMSQNNHQYIDIRSLGGLCAIELDGGTFQGIRSGHSSGVGLRNWREKNNSAMTAGWRVWHYAPEEVIKAGRKILPDEPILRRLPWL